MRIPVYQRAIIEPLCMRARLSSSGRNLLRLEQWQEAALIALQLDDRDGVHGLLRALIENRGPAELSVAG